MIEFRDDDIQRIEHEIIRVYNDGRACDYTQNGSLLEVRKWMINKRALARQEELQPHIIAFNDALTEALRKMYDRACSVWEAMRNQLDAGEQADLTANATLVMNIPRFTRCKAMTGRTCGMRCATADGIHCILMG